MPIGFLPGPLLFFYVRNELRGTMVIKKADLFHFLPCVLCLFSLLPYYFLNFEYKLDLAKTLIDNPSVIVVKTNISWLYPSYINFLIRPILLAAYAIASLVMVRQFLNNRGLKFSLINSELIVKWIVFVCAILLLIGLVFILFTLVFLLNDQGFRKGVLESEFLKSFCYVLLGIIPLIMLGFPEVLYNVKKAKKAAIVEVKENHKDMISVANTILLYMNEEKNILNSNLNLTDLCSEFGLNRSEISYCFTIILKTKFTVLRKEIRINYAKKILETTNLDIHSLENVWMKSGFKSRTTFFVAFKEVTGLTPIQYLDSANKA
jgi:AraC-like DNA-binding protein